ncbi:MAG: S8 family serine peptidase, partial [Verrucomicrobiota bacterium]
SQFGVFSGDGRDSGVCVVKSAGNVGNRQGHTSTDIPFNGKKTIDFQILKDGIPPSLCIELWFESCFPMEVTAISPDKKEVATLTIKPGVDPKAEGETSAKKNTVLLTSNRYDSDNGATRVSLRIHPGSGMTGYETGTWSIRLRRLLSFNRETARVDAWIDLRDSPVLTPVRFVRSTNDMALTIPGTASHLVTVGAVTRADRPKVAAPFSSQGPTRDGKPKPEICAPGSKIRGAKAHSGTGLMTANGTSFAAPQVTGAIALLMAKKMEAGEPLPNATQIRHALIHSSSGYNGTHDPACGFGMLNVDKFLEEL